MIFKFYFKDIFELQYKKRPTKGAVRIDQKLNQKYNYKLSYQVSYFNLNQKYNSRNILGGKKNQLKTSWNFYNNLQKKNI